MPCVLSRFRRRKTFFKVRYQRGISLPSQSITERVFIATSACYAHVVHMSRVPDGKGESEVQL